MITNTDELIKLLDIADRTIATGSQVRGILAAAREKLILLSAAQSAAKAGASQELLAQILDEQN
jgi:hypothetical protein